MLEIRPLWLKHPVSDERLEMGLTRDRVFSNPLVLEEVLDYVAYAGWHDSNVNYRIKQLHNHTDNIIFVTRGGCGILEIGGIFYKMPANTIAILPKYVELSYYTDPNAGHWDFYWMHVYGVNITNVLHKLYQNHVYVVSLGADDLTESLSEICESILECPYEGNEMTLHNSRRISDLLHLFVEKTIASGIILADNNDFVKTIVQFIEQNYMNPIDMNDIANKVFLTVECTIRNFKKYTGYTPHAYLKMFRIMKACDYLINTDLSVKDIARCVGYKSDSNFIAEFRAMKEITPNRFRNRMKL